MGERARRYKIKEIVERRKYLFLLKEVEAELSFAVVVSHVYLQLN